MNSNMKNRAGGGGVDHFSRVFSGGNNIGAGGTGAGGSNDRMSFMSRFRDDSGHFRSNFDQEIRDDEPGYDTWGQAPAKTANKYELDWYFWDKDGKFKIIR